MTRPFSIDLSGKGRTKQSHKEECDINTIMKRFEKTGIVDHLNTHQGNYGDFTVMPDSYQAAVIHLQEAQDMFMTLPASIRAKFENDPGQFLDFASDPENLPEMRKLGLAPQRPADEDQPKPKRDPKAPESDPAFATDPPPATA
ncbi:internal scaffolding protein [Microviridae sp.]|nr:internal scaffolding protein [Microviridae sp.]